MGHIRREVQRCLRAGMTRLHVDIFDSVALQSPCAFTFGPDMVQVLVASVVEELNDADTENTTTPVILDLHMCVHKPQRFVEAMADACRNGCTLLNNNEDCPPVQLSFIFQWEGLPKLGRQNKARALAQHVLAHGMRCGISLNPSTPVEELYQLLQVTAGLISVVDVLAVEPGFGGQSFQPHVLGKVQALQRWRNNVIMNATNEEANTTTTKRGLDFDILVDGGANKDTAPSIREAGADILVSGSFLFAHEQGLEAGMRELLSSS